MILLAEFTQLSHGRTQLLAERDQLPPLYPPPQKTIIQNIIWGIIIRTEILCLDNVFQKTLVVLIFFLSNFPLNFQLAIYYGIPLPPATTSPNSICHLLALGLGTPLTLGMLLFFNCRDQNFKLFHQWVNQAYSHHLIVQALLTALYGIRPMCLKRKSHGYGHITRYIWDKSIWHWKIVIRRLCITGVR